jgi:diketogulonate reductase-like aldo/keto reductase
MRLLQLSSLFALAAAQQPLPITPPKGTELNDIPILGLGTWYLSGQNGTEAVASAIQNGYRHIDAAWYYKNQEIVGPGIKEGLRRTGLSRKDVWITSKLWNSQ